MALLEKGVALMMWWAISGVLSFGAVPLLLPVFAGQLRQNYLGEAVPTGLGVAFVIPSALIMVVRADSERYALLFALVILFFAILGLVDDVYGEQSRKGFGGHFRSRNISTGALKAWVGMAASFAVASQLSEGWFQLVLNGVIIALMANLLNLFDLRPGRAAKTFLLFGFVFFLLKPQVLGPLLGMLWAVGGFLSWDLRRVVMMGDVGSNPLGAGLGLACVISCPLFGKVILALVLVALNALSEKVSFSKVIESNRFLRYLDELGR